MDIIGTVLWPIKWVIEAILVFFHFVFESLGMPGADGITWVLSIVGLVLVVRAALIPIFVRQIKSQRRMLEVAPQLKKIQDKYKGKKDQFSREAMSRETMAMYKKTGTNPLSSCLPLLLQMPIFFGLFSVLQNAQHEGVGVGLLTTGLSKSFGESVFLGAPLKLAISTAVTVHHSTADHVEEPVAGNQSEPDVQAAKNALVCSAVRLPVLRVHFPARCHVLLARIEPVDHGPAVHRHPQHADPWQ